MLEKESWVYSSYFVLPSVVAARYKRNTPKFNDRKLPDEEDRASLDHGLTIHSSWVDYLRVSNDSIIPYFREKVKTATSQFALFSAYYSEAPGVAGWASRGLKNDMPQGNLSLDVINRSPGASHAIDRQSRRAFLGRIRTGARSVLLRQGAPWTCFRPDLE